ncbi:MAG: lytic transglycosylase, partial [Proteobacteria bacterium]
MARRSSRFALVAACFAACIAARGAIADPADEARAAVRARDYGRAAALYRELAEGGDAEAQYQLAALHRVGRGVLRSDA